MFLKVRCQSQIFRQSRTALLMGAQNPSQAVPPATISLAISGPSTARRHLNVQFVARRQLAETTFVNTLKMFIAPMSYRNGLPKGVGVYGMRLGLNSCPSFSFNSVFFLKPPLLRSVCMEVLFSSLVSKFI